MSRLARAVLLTAAVAMLWPAAALAYPPYPSEIVGFNGGGPDNLPIDVYSAREMFNLPENSGSTNMYIQITDPNHADYNEAYRSSDGALNPVDAACLHVYFYWLDPLDVNAWVRLNTNNGTLRPNPSVNTQGKVRFQITNTGDENFLGTFGLCLGIRETGVTAVQMKDGGATGCIEWVGVSSVKTGITAGADRVVNTAATGGDVQVFAVGYDFSVMDPNAPYDTPVILPATGQPLMTTVSGDDQYRRGYYLDDNGTRRPIPAISLVPSGFAYQVEWDLATGNVTVDGSVQDPCNPGTFAPFADSSIRKANGVLDPNDNRGTLEHLAITNIVPSDPNLAVAKVNFGIDQLQFESPVPDPTVAPRVRAPILQGSSAEVTVTDLMYAVNRIELYKNGSFSQGVDVSDNTDYLFYESCVTGDKYSARQRNGQNNTWSDLSPEVTVLSGPPPYSMSLMVDENAGGSCVATGWEWVGVTSVSGYVPQGYNLIVPNDAVWQTVDIPLNDPALIKATGFGGNGVLGPSSTGYYTMDSVWLSIGPGLDAADPNNQGPFEILFDAIQYVDPNGNATTIIDEENSDQFSFARGQSPQTTLTYGRTSNGSYDGLQSHLTGWSYTSTATSLGELQRIGTGCGNQPLIPQTAAAIRYHIVARGKATAPGVALPIVNGPIIGAQTAVRVSYDPNSTLPTSVQLYVNGTAVGSPQAPDPNNSVYMDFSGLTIALGDSVSATQVIGGVTSDFAYPRASAAPTAPTVASPIYPAATTVTVNNITNVVYARASQVNVIVRDPNGTIVQNVPKVLDPNGVTTTTVTVTALVTNQTVTATQTVNSVVGPESASVLVAVSAPIITMAPPEGATVVKIQGVVTGATQVNLYVYDDPNQTTASATYSAAPDPNNPSVAYVPITSRGLVAGNMIKAAQVYLGNESPQSVGDPVTVATVTNCNPSWVAGPPFPETFETYADQADMDNDTYPTLEIRDRGWWNSSGDPSLTLVDSANPINWTDPNHPVTADAYYYKNATPGGTKSIYAAYPLSPRLMDPNDHAASSYENGFQCNFDFSYPDPNWIGPMATWSAPLIWNVDIYDSGGAGSTNPYQWAELRNYDTSLNNLIAVGMPGAGFFSGCNNNYYSARVGDASPVYFNPNVTGATVRSVGWHTFTVVVKPAVIDVYVDGTLTHKNLSRKTGANKAFNNFYMGSGYSGNWDAWYDDYDVKLGGVYFGVRLPNYPVLATPITAGDTTVSLSRIEAGVTAVTVYANGSPIANVNPNGATSLVVTVPALVKGNMIKTTATSAQGISEFGPAYEVGGGNGKLLVCLGIRETNDPNTALGGVGGTSGPLEWIGATGTYPGFTLTGGAATAAAPIGTKVLTVQDGWQTLTFDSSTDPIFGWPSSGDGAIDPNKPGNGVLEHIAITIDPNDPLKSSGPYTLYIDDVINVGAGTGGADFLVTGFEGYTPPANVLFQVPNYSGSTSWNVASSPNTSESSADFALTGTQSEKVAWFFKDTTAGRWIRLTTTGASNLVRPVINHRLPIRISFKLSGPVATGACCTNYVCTIATQADCLAGSGKFMGVGTTCTAGICACRGDASCDGLISYADINPFVQAIGNLSAWQAAHPTCPWQNCDVNADGVVSYADINPFVQKVGTPGPCP